MFWNIPEFAVKLCNQQAVTAQSVSQPTQYRQAEQAGATTTTTASSYLQSHSEIDHIELLTSSVRGETETDGLLK